MLPILKEVHFWSTQEDVSTKATDYGSFRYSGKKDVADVYSSSKQSYAEQRGYLWHPTNKRGNKLKDKLKDLEEYLLQCKVVCSYWKEECLKLLLQNGILVTININLNTADIISIAFDKHIVQKISNDYICDAVFCNDNFSICLVSDGRLIGINIGNSPSNNNASRELWIIDINNISNLCNNSSSSTSVPQPPLHLFASVHQRRLSQHGDWLAVWAAAGVTSSGGLTCTMGTTSTADQPQPWSPLARDHQRANLHVYWLGLGGGSVGASPMVRVRVPQLATYRRTDGDPIEVRLSQRSVEKVGSGGGTGAGNKELLLVEQKVSHRGAVSVELTQLELHLNTPSTITQIHQQNNTVLRRTAITSIPLPTHCSCAAFSPCERRLLLACVDGSIAILDRERGATRMVRAHSGLIPTVAAWHHAQHQQCDREVGRCGGGALVVVGNERGQMQYYDVALQAVQYELVQHEDSNAMNATFDLSEYLMSIQSASPKVSLIQWRGKHLFVAMEGGPLLIINYIHEASLSFRSLAGSYLRSGAIDRTIALLQTWEFDAEGFAVLQSIVRHVLGQCIGADRGLKGDENAARWLQEAFGVFYCPAIPLSGQIRHKYGAQVKALTRRFFHQLVRCRLFEMAFLLAVDLAHHDLFMDLHFIAVRLGHTEMAAAARAQAEALLSRCSSVSSNCSRSSCSQCSQTSSSVQSSEDLHSLVPLKETTKLSSEAAATALLSDNYLSTNFNSIIPKTYKSTVNIATIPTIDLPKINYIKPAPNSSKPTSSNNNNSTRHIPTIVPPPLPQVPTATLLPDLNQDIGIPIVDEFTPQFLPCHNSARPYPALSNRSLTNTSTNMMNSPLYLNNFPQPYPFRFDSVAAGPLRSIVPPPLPVAPIFLANNSIYPLVKSTDVSAPKHPHQQLPISTPPSNSSSTKKAQAKVKFSDTVTAFIVPEVKRPVRPQPPAHVTDPQKELADSLPLCHPNEDYLKDFTPIRKEREEADMSVSSATAIPSGSSVIPPQTPPVSKIKVVHFGVV